MNFILIPQEVLFAPRLKYNDKKFEQYFYYTILDVILTNIESLDRVFRFREESDGIGLPPGAPITPQMIDNINEIVSANGIKIVHDRLQIVITYKLNLQYLTSILPLIKLHELNLICLLREYNKYPPSYLLTFFYFPVGLSPEWIFLYKNFKKIAVYYRAVIMYDKSDFNKKIHKDFRMKIVFV